MMRNRIKYLGNFKDIDSDLISKKYYRLKANLSYPGKIIYTYFYEDLKRHRSWVNVEILRYNKKILSVTENNKNIKNINIWK